MTARTEALLISCTVSPSLKRFTKSTESWWWTIASCHVLPRAPCLRQHLIFDLLERHRQERKLLVPWNASIPTSFSWMCTCQ